VLFRSGSESYDSKFYSIKGKAIAFTDPISHKTARNLEKYGAKSVSFVNREVDFLVVSGEDPHSSAQKEMAEMFNIPIFSESYFEQSLSNIQPSSPKKRKQSYSPIESHKRKKRISKPLSSSANIPRSSFKEAELLVMSYMPLDKGVLNAVIALEGNIGVGKSTLSSKFKTIYPKRCAVYKEKGNEKFLQLFYEDPKTYGFAFQWGMLKTRQFQLSLAKHDTKHGRLPPRQFYFWDRSMIGDYIFALLNHMLGSISPQEMAVYEDEFGGSINSLASISFFSAVDCYVLLNDEPASCKYRVENLRANQSESSIPLTYYENIDDIHYSLFVDHLLPLKIVKILFLTWGQYNDPKAIWELLLLIVNQKKELPYARRVLSLPEKEDPELFLPITSRN